MVGKGFEKTCESWPLGRRTSEKQVGTRIATMGLVAAVLEMHDLCCECLEKHRGRE